MWRHSNIWGKAALAQQAFRAAGQEKGDLCASQKTEEMSSVSRRGQEIWDMFACLFPSCDIHSPLQKYNMIWHHQKAIPERNTKAIHFYHPLLLSLKRQQKNTQNVLGHATLYLAKMRATWIYIYIYTFWLSRLHCLLSPSLDYLKYIYSQI